MLPREPLFPGCRISLPVGWLRCFLGEPMRICCWATAARRWWCQLYHFASSWVAVLGRSDAGCSSSHGSWRDWVVGQGRLTTDVLSPRISCGLPFGVAFLVWMRGEDDDDACWSAASRMKQRHNWEDQRKKKRVLFVISKFRRDPFAKRGSSILDHVFMLM